MGRWRQSAEGLVCRAQSREDEAWQLSQRAKDLLREARGLRAQAGRLTKDGEARGLRAQAGKLKNDVEEEDPEEDHPKRSASERFGREDPEEPLVAGRRERSRSGPELGFVPGMGEELLIDDDDAAMVLVFTKCQEKGGTIDPEEEIQDPMVESRKIFSRQSNPDSHQTMQWGIDCFGASGVNAAMYHEVVRSKVLSVLQNSGIRAETFESIDGDEIFVKLSLRRDGEVLKSLAQRYQYRMPFKREAYEDVPTSGSYPGGRPMRNSDGQEVPGYTEFEFELEELVQPFRQVDEIRLLQARLDEWMSLEELVRQKIISRYFAAANYGMAMRLHEEWATLRKMVALPSHRNEDLVRDYFGEAVAFFFRWYCTYTRSMVPLALIGLVFFFRGEQALNFSIDTQRYLQYVFAAVLLVWATIFQEIFKNLNYRAQQYWGMKDFDEHSIELSSYRPELEGTWNLAFRKFFSKMIVVLFCIGFMGLVSFLEWHKVKSSERQENFIEPGLGSSKGKGTWSTNPILITFLIKASGFAWKYMAPWLVGLQNHRTQARWNDALSVYLASVKIFVALFPFMDIAFLKKFKGITCPAAGQNDLASATWRLYGTDHWPRGMPQPTWNATTHSWEQPPGRASLEELFRGFFFEAEDGRACFYGCYPVQCFHSLVGAGETDGGKFCVTNCDEELETGLFTFYITHIACTVLFLVVPILLTRWEVKKEFDQARSQTSAENEGEGEEECGYEALHEARHSRKRVYSFTQFQAKCHELANYEYNSWGGSYCEDFLEVAMGFALLTCFGIQKPIMAVCAFISSVVEYRLLAYRMTNITCRPMPLGAEGIGIWQEVFEGISMVAVATNVAMAVFVMHPMRSWTLGHRFLAFLLLEHFMLLLRVVINVAIPDEPEDVQQVEDFNVRFKKKFVKYGKLHVPKGEWYSMANVNIGLGVSWL